ncbi:uncharacterized protein LOC111376981 isoform X2 [Olea europaea var. sylvestris]|uniref:uncharacterized protein LOC111376981 isoform X2 n=1 Tax=Olea europaea var. sylvestris TaxID=158386 RepID=UPI000C1D13E6|nr:uncharacterized protein LOC111376981 isoform X2 [Olea europaea var. sylvestris]
MHRTHKRLFELLNSSGVAYNESTDQIVASKEWWNRKIKENKDDKEFKDKDVNNIYVRYRQLFGDKYAVTPTKLCKTGFCLFEDSVLEDNMDVIPIDGESSGSCDEMDKANVGVGINVSSTTSGRKRKSSSAKQRGKKKKISARELLFSIDRATSAGEKVAVKINTMMTSKNNAGIACVEELLATGRLQRRTPLYFFACALLAQKRYWDMLGVMNDVNEKFEWIEWMFNERDKQLHL